MGSTEESALEHEGWRFRSFRGPIASATELMSLNSDLQLGNIPLPEETYARSFIEVTNERFGVELRVDALGALRSWHEAQLRSHPYPTVLSFDWTYSNCYGGDLIADGQRMLALGSRRDLDGASGRPSWSQRAEGLPLARLTHREPIIYYAEVVLYADDLHDRGRAEVTAKIRVMPSCCLLLVRAFLRIDGVRAALHDTRWYIDFTGAPAFDVPSTATERNAAASAWAAVRPALQSQIVGGRQEGPERQRPPPSDGAASGLAELLCSVQERRGPMDALRAALGLPLVAYESAMLRADAAQLAETAAVETTQAEAGRGAAGGAEGPAATAALEAGACSKSGAAPPSATPGVADAAEPGGGFHFAVDADDVAALAPVYSETCALTL